MKRRSRGFRAQHTTISLLSLALLGCAGDVKAVVRLPPAPGAYFTEKVPPGESLSALAQRFHVKEDDLLALNDIEDRSKPLAGGAMRIPAYSRLYEARQAKLQAKRPAPPPIEQPRQATPEPPPTQVAAAAEPRTRADTPSVPPPQPAQAAPEEWEPERPLTKQAQTDPPKARPATELTEDELAVGGTQNQPPQHVSSDIPTPQQRPEEAAGNPRGPVPEPVLPVARPVQSVAHDEPPAHPALPAARPAQLVPTDEPVLPVARPAQLVPAGAPVLPVARPDYPVAEVDHAKQQPAQGFDWDWLTLPPREPTASVKFIWPVQGRVIASFGPSASGGRNDGINISARPGTPVHAAAAGTISYVGNELKGYGNLILIRHDNGYVTAYAHSDRVTVNRGDRVERGEIIAYAGATGNVTQPQLHFELRVGTRAVDPSPYLVASN